jgi:hypothetical protein
VLGLAFGEEALALAEEYGEDHQAQFVHLRPGGGEAFVGDAAEQLGLGLLQLLKLEPVLFERIQQYAFGGKTSTSEIAIRSRPK